MVRLSGAPGEICRECFRPELLVLHDALYIAAGNDDDCEAAMIDLEFVEMSAVPLFVGLAWFIGYEYIKHFIPPVKRKRNQHRPYLARIR